METLDTRLQKRMHVSLYALLFLTVLLGLSVLLEGCSDKCETKHQYTYYEPVYTPMSEIRASAGLVAPQTINSVGKIYIKGKYLFMNDPGKGIHIIDNENPSSPLQKAFLQIPGNFDLAVKGNTLYADSYIDLVVFDIADINNIEELSRVENVFEHYNYVYGFAIDSERGMITGWEEKEQVQVTVTDCETTADYYPVMTYEAGIAVSDASSFNKSLAIAPGNGSGPGVGGSMARFTINNNHLYTLNNGYIQPFDITTEMSPSAKEKMYVNWDVETIFPYGQNLFIGSSSGMHIYDVSEPASPVKISTYQHISSCDPVVVQDKFAYVTLRSGTECQGFTNQLEVINIEDLSQPQLIKVYPMTNPFGLGIDNTTLFICDGDDGLKVYNAEDVHTIDQKLLAHYKSINAFDVIPFNNLLIMIGSNGLYQYDYSNPQTIKLLSHIPIHAN